MKKLLIGSALLSSLLFAGGTITPNMETSIENTLVVEDSSSWNFEFSPYFAMTSISGTSAIGRAGESDLSLDFDQIVDALEFGISTHFEAQHNSGWGLWLDYSYVSLGGSQNTSIGNISVDIKQGIFEGLGMYRQNLSNGTIDYMAGVRSWRMKITTDVLTLRQIDETWIDFIVGTRWTKSLNENWDFMLRGDIGTGDSDFTATAATGVRYHINEYLDLDITYKALWVDYETGTPNKVNHFKYDTSTYGPIIGINFKF